MLRRSMDRLERWLENLPGGPLLLGGIGVVFVLQMMFAKLGRESGGSPFAGFSGIEAWAAGSVSPRAVVERRELFRLFTGPFLHGGLLHFLFNASFLVNMGRTIEELLGSRRFLVTFLATGVLGGIASLGWMAWRGEPSAGSVGASGALCGFMGTLLAHCRRSRSAASQYMVRQITTWCVAILAFGLLSGGRIDNAGHIGGFVAGYVLAPILGTSTFDPLLSRWKRRALTLSTLALLLGTVASLIIAGVGARDRRDALTDGLAFQSSLFELQVASDAAVRERGSRQIQLRLVGQRHWSDELAELRRIGWEDGVDARLAALRERVDARLAELAPDLMVPPRR